MRSWLGRLLAFVPTRRAALVLFALALAVFWFQALGWPMAKGRDTWDYLVYYLQLFDSDPPLSQVQLFRAPLTPLVVGLPMDLGGTVLLEIVFGVLFAGSVVAWSATALTFGRVPALASAVLLLVYPAWATLYHQASSDAVFATGLAVWALILARTMRRPSTRGFVALGLGLAALVLIRPANQVLLPAVLAPLLAAAVPWRRRLTWVAACCAAAVLPLAAWAVHNGVRYDDLTVTRGGRAWVPFLRVFTADRSISPEHGPASQRLGRLVEDEVLAKEPFASLGVPLDAYLANGSNYETVRLIALSDRVLGRDSNYDVLFDSAVEAIRADPESYARGVADVVWEFLTQRPIRESIAPRAQTAPTPPSPTFESDGVVLPNPQAHILVDGVPYGFVWCASDYIDSCILRDPSRRLGRPRRPAAVSRGRRPGAGLGRRAPVPDRRGVADGDPQPDHAAVPAAAALARRRRRRARLAAAAGLADDRRPLGVRGRRAPDPRRLAGRRPRVRAPALSALHRHRPRRARGGPGDAAPGGGLMRRAAPWLPLAAVTLAGAVLRFATLDAQSFWLDELVTVSLLDRGLGDALAEVPRSEATPYAYYVVAWLWGQVFGLGEVGLRSLSALAGTATIPVAYGAGAALVSRRAGLVAAALVAANPFLVWYAQEARSYALFALAGAATVLAFGHALRGSGRWLAAWAVLAALAVATHYFAVFLVAAEALWLLLRLRGARRVVARVPGAGGGAPGPRPAAARAARQR